MGPLALFSFTQWLGICEMRLSILKDSWSFSIFFCERRRVPGVTGRRSMPRTGTASARRTVWPTHTSCR